MRRVRNTLRLWFSLRVPVGPRDYLVWGLTLMVVKYLVDATVMRLGAHVSWSPIDYLNPVYGVRGVRTSLTPGLRAALFLWTLPFLWIGASMTVRRAVDAGRPAWGGLLFFVPVLNYLVMVFLCFLPSRPHATADEPASIGPAAPAIDRRVRSAMLGLGASLAIGLGLGVLCTEVFRSYGLSVFFGTPFVASVVSGFVHNRYQTRPVRETVLVATTGLLLVAGALLLFAVEGMVCVAMALPFVVPIAAMGGLFGSRARASEAPEPRPGDVGGARDPAPGRAGDTTARAAAGSRSGVERGRRGAARGRVAARRVLRRAPAAARASVPPRRGVSPAGDDPGPRRGRAEAVRVLDRRVRGADHRVGRATTIDVRRDRATRSDAGAESMAPRRGAPSGRRLPRDPRRVPSLRATGWAHAARRQHLVRAAHRARQLLVAVGGQLRGDDPSPRARAHPARSGNGGLGAARGRAEGMTGPGLADALVTLEPAGPENADLLIGWTMDPVAQGPFKRVPSLSTGELRALFLEDSDRSYFVLRRSSDAAPLGRFYWRAWRFGGSTDPRVDWELNIFLADPRERGKGYGTAAQRLAARHLATLPETRSVFAFTLVGNDAERRALLKAGFQDRGLMPNESYPVFLPAEPCVLFVWP